MLICPPSNVERLTVPFSVLAFQSIRTGIGVGLTRDTATLMVGQYFKRRREAVEIALVGSSGIGLAVMTVFLHTTLGLVFRQHFIFEIGQKFHFL